MTHADDSRQEWERFSASGGMAVYSQDDETAERVFKRADNDMYHSKLLFREKHGSYR